MTKQTICNCHNSYQCDVCYEQAKIDKRARDMEKPLDTNRSIGKVLDALDGKPSWWDK